MIRRLATKIIFIYLLGVSNIMALPGEGVESIFSQFNQTGSDCYQVSGTLAKSIKGINIFNCNENKDDESFCSCISKIPIDEEEINKKSIQIEDKLKRKYKDHLIATKSVDLFFDELKVLHALSLHTNLDIGICLHSYTNNGPAKRYLSQVFREYISSKSVEREPNSSEKYNFIRSMVRFVDQDENLTQNIYQQFADRDSLMSVDKLIKDNPVFASSLDLSRNESDNIRTSKGGYQKKIEALNGFIFSLQFQNLGSATSLPFFFDGKKDRINDIRIKFEQTLKNRCDDLQNRIEVFEDQNLKNNGEYTDSIVAEKFHSLKSDTIEKKPSLKDLIQLSTRKSPEKDFDQYIEQKFYSDIYYCKAKKKYQASFNEVLETSKKEGVSEKIAPLVKQRTELLNQRVDLRDHILDTEDTINLYEEAIKEAKTQEAKEELSAVVLEDQVYLEGLYGKDYELIQKLQENESKIREVYGDNTKTLLAELDVVYRDPVDIIEDDFETGNVEIKTLDQVVEELRSESEDKVEALKDSKVMNAMTTDLKAEIIKGEKEEVQKKLELHEKIEIDDKKAQDFINELAEKKNIRLPVEVKEEHIERAIDKMEKNLSKSGLSKKYFEKIANKVRDKFQAQKQVIRSLQSENKTIIQRFKKRENVSDKELSSFLKSISSTNETSRPISALRQSADKHNNDFLKKQIKSLERRNEALSNFSAPLSKELDKLTNEIRKSKVDIKALNQDLEIISEDTPVVKQVIANPIQAQKIKTPISVPKALSAQAITPRSPSISSRGSISSSPTTTSSAQGVTPLRRESQDNSGARLFLKSSPKLTLSLDEFSKLDEKSLLEKVPVESGSEQIVIMAKGEQILLEVTKVDGKPKVKILSQVKNIDIVQAIIDEKINNLTEVREVARYHDLLKLIEDTKKD